MLIFNNFSITTPVLDPKMSLDRACQELKLCLKKESRLRIVLKNRSLSFLFSNHSKMSKFNVGLVVVVINKKKHDRTDDTRQTHTWNLYIFGLIIFHS